MLEMLLGYYLLCLNQIVLLMLNIILLMTKNVKRSFLEFFLNFSDFLKFLKKENFFLNFFLENF